MKNLVKTVLLTTVMAVSTNATAYGDWFAMQDRYTKEEIKNVNFDELKTYEERLMYHYSEAIHAFQAKDSGALKVVLPKFKGLFDSTKDARAAFAYATFKMDVTRIECKGARNYGVCVDPIDPEVVKYYEIAGFADNTGNAATDLMSYYYGRYGEVGDAHGRYWAKMGQDFVDDYYKNRPARNFKALEDQPEVKIGFWAKLGF